MIKGKRWAVSQSKTRENPCTTKKANCKKISIYAYDLLWRYKSNRVDNI